MGFSRIFACFGRPRSDYSSQILKLKAQRDELEDYKEVLERRLTRFDDMCLKFVKDNDRNNAISILKRKALVSRQLNIIESFTLKILELISASESAKVESEVIKKLEIGSKLIREINKEIKRKDLDSFFEADKRNLDEIASSLGILNRNFEVDDLELVQELDLLTNDLHSFNYDQFYNQNTPRDQYDFDLDLTRLKANSQGGSVMNTLNTTFRKA